MREVTLTENGRERGGNLIAPTSSLRPRRACSRDCKPRNHAQRTASCSASDARDPCGAPVIVTEPDRCLSNAKRKTASTPCCATPMPSGMCARTRGLDIGTVMREERACAVEYGVPDSFPPRTSPLDLERIEEEYMSMIQPDPVFGNVGLKDRFQWPSAYPDGNPLVGPAPRTAANMCWRGLFPLASPPQVAPDITSPADDGRRQSRIDMASLDPKRFGSWITTNTPCQERGAIDQSMSCTTPTRNAPPAAP